MSGSNTLEVTGNAKIINNTAGSDGGGILINGAAASPCSVNIGEFAEISNNSATGRGGGIICTSITNSSASVVHTITVSGSAKIVDNTAGTTGGGIYSCNGSTVNIGGGKVSENTAGTDGGGLFISKTGKLNVIANGMITGNIAGRNGGGIFTQDTEYKNLSSEYANLNIAADTIFSGNKSVKAYLPPDDAAVLYPDVQFASVSVASHPINNDDINYIGTKEIKYVVIYNANGGEGGSSGDEIAANGTDTVKSMSESGVSRSGYDFMGWNTAADGTGTAYAPGEEITLNGNVELYAQWEEIKELPPPAVVPIQPQTSPPTKPEENDNTDTEDDTDTGDDDNQPGDDSDPEGEGSGDDDYGVTSTPPDNTGANTGSGSSVQAPVPVNINSELVPNDNGGYIEFDENGTPLGIWTWNEDTEEWIFDKYVPLGGLPHTGDSLAPLVTLALSALLVSGLFIERYLRKKKR